MIAYFLGGSSSGKCLTNQYESNRMNSQKNSVPISDCIEAHLHDYFHALGHASAHDVYDMVLRQVEKPLLKTVLDYCDGNQTRAAEMLGINRNTLRKKLLQYDLTEK